MARKWPSFFFSLRKATTVSTSWSVRLLMSAGFSRPSARMPMAAFSMPSQSMPNIATLPRHLGLNSSPQDSVLFSAGIFEAL